MPDRPDPWTGRIAGILLLAGTVVFFAGARMYVSVLGSASITRPESLDPGGGEPGSPALDDRTVGGRRLS